VSRSVPYKAVHASRGKVTRAEPVSALYEQGKVHHVGGAMTVLEDQMTSFTSDFDRSRMGYSPDRVDALVWALTEFLPGMRRPMNVSASAVEAAKRAPRRFPNSITRGF
jgi:phage terminase large subunit-like protein